MAASEGYQLVLTTAWCHSTLVLSSVYGIVGLDGDALARQHTERSRWDRLPAAMLNPVMDPFFRHDWKLKLEDIPLQRLNHVAGTVSEACL